MLRRDFIRGTVVLTTVGPIFAFTDKNAKLPPVPTVNKNVIELTGVYGDMFELASRQPAQADGRVHARFLVATPRYDQLRYYINEHDRALGPLEPVRTSHPMRSTTTFGHLHVEFIFMAIPSGFHASKIYGHEFTGAYLPIPFYDGHTECTVRNRIGRYPRHCVDGRIFR
jgi:hypothetical protein